MTTVVHHLYVQGMMCQRNCGTTVQQALLADFPGATAAAAVFAESRAWVQTTSDATSVAAVEAVEDVGFEATACHCIELRVDGMMCQQNCGSTVQQALQQAFPQALSVQVSFVRRRAVVLLPLSAGETPVLEEAFQNMAMEAVEDVGFEARLWTPEDDDGTSADVDVEAGVTTYDGDTDLSNELSSSGNKNTSFSLAIEGMSCAVCTGRVETALRDVPGVADVTVILGTQRAAVVADHTYTDEELSDLAETCQTAVETAGYTCPHVLWPHNASLRQSAQQMAESRIRDRLQWRRLFFGSAAALIPIIVLHRVHHRQQMMMSLPTLTFVMLLATAVQFGTGGRYYTAAYRGWVHSRTMGMDFLVVMGTTGSYVYSMAIYAMRVMGIDNKDNLQPTFMTGVMLLTFVSMGKWLEAIAKGNTSMAIQSLMEMQPSEATRLTQIPTTSWNDHLALDWAALQTEVVDTEQIVPGDFVKVLPGERLPADGILVAISSVPSKESTDSPRAFVDESSFSGEPFPVTKRWGDVVSGGTVNVSSSALIIEVTAAGADSLLAKIVQLVEDAQRHKAPIQMYADKVAAVFCPVVMSLALVTLVFWLFVAEEDRIFVSIMSAISVIVVACPCALGLATPCAVLVGTGVAAGHGLLIKGGDVLEKMQQIDTVVFDKTGTITSGKPSLSSVETFLDVDDPIQQNLPVEKAQLVLWLACVAELNSEHPISTAIVEEGKRAVGDDITLSHEGVTLRDFTAEPGRGVECIIQSPHWGPYNIRVGKREWTKEALNGQISKNETLGDKEVDRMRRRGEIAVYMSVWNLQPGTARQVIGVLGVNDPVKPEARSTVQALSRMGIDVWMCTGDARATALTVAEQVGIAPANVRAGVTPQGKGDLVSELQKNSTVNRRSLSFWASSSKRTVAMVADGVNDAVALAKAEVGFAIGAGTQVAVEAADVVLVKSHLHDVVVALHLSTVVFRRILLNLVCAMVYNVCALPFAAGLLTPFTDFRLPPAAAGLMMAVSSVTVVTSSLLLKAYHKPTILEDGKLSNAANELLGTSMRSLRLRRKYVGVPTETSDLELV